jgi:hypothetical protein
MKSHDFEDWCNKWEAILKLLDKRDGNIQVSLIPDHIKAYDQTWNRGLGN